MLLKRQNDGLGVARGYFNAIILSVPLWATIAGGAYFLTGCAPTTSKYEICDTPNCGDNVTVEVVK